jgi:hypothetical protein
MKKLRSLSLIALAVALLAFGACAKKTSEDKQNITAAEDFAIMETEFSGAFEVSDDVNQTDGKIKKGSSTILPNGAVLTFKDSLFSDSTGIEYTVDFGPLAPMGLLCKDGRYRSGVLHVKVSDRYGVVGTKVEVWANEVDQYHSGDGTNMYEISGLLAIERTAVESLKIEVTDGMASLNGEVREFHGLKTIKRTLGNSTLGIIDDEYEVTGSGGGKTRAGNVFTWNIEAGNPLVKKMELGCAKTFVKGVIEVKDVSATSALKIDFDPYGNAACDRIARATIGKKEFIFTVK